jgi:hypothetical protein
MGKLLAYITVGIGIVATIIGIFDLNLAIKILVDAIIVACFVGVLIAVVRR